jgi:predicted ATPase
MHLKKLILIPDRYPTLDYYPFNLDIFTKTHDIAFTSPVTFFVGENGSGKSTLVKAITYKCGLNIWKGIQRTRFKFNPFEEQLYRAIEIEWTNGRVPGSLFSSELFQNFARILDEWAAADPGILDYFGGQSLLTQSHGQSILSFFKARYKIKGLYLLDEPETALSPNSLLELLRLLKEMGDAGHAQFIIATHSPILMACPGAQIYSFDAIPLDQIDYEETEHYKIYRDFMKNRDKYLKS